MQVEKADSHGPVPDAINNDKTFPPQTAALEICLQFGKLPSVGFGDLAILKTGLSEYD